MSDETPVAAQWRQFLIDAELACQHKAITRFANGFGGRAPYNPTLETLLPGLLYIRLGAILDGAFKTYISSQGLGKPRRDNFDERITFLANKKLLAEPSPVRAIRVLRNDLAHDTGQTAPCAWEELEAAIETAHVALEDLGLVDPRPRYQFYAESGIREGPPRPGVYCTRDYEYGLKLDGRWAARVAWSVDTMNGRGADA